MSNIYIVVMPDLIRYPDSSECVDVLDSRLRGNDKDVSALMT
jgi:hypothetical protein